MGIENTFVELSGEDRKTLNGSPLPVNGEPKTTHAHVSFWLMAGSTDLTISEHVGYHPKPSVHNTHQDYTERGIAAIHRRKPDFVI